LTWFGGGSVGSTTEEVERRVRDDFIRNSGIWGTRDQVTAKIEALIKAGCTYFMFDSRGIPEPGELEMLIEVTKQFA
jgi:hypothetical protein